MVLTEEQQSDMYPAATMETASTATEEALYANLNTTRIAKPVSYPVDNTTNPNANVAKVTAATGGQKVGPSITLKVMAGDKFNLKVSSWYKTSGATPGTPVSPLPDLLAALISGVSGASGGKVATTQLQTSGVLTPGATNFLNSQTPAAGRPKAYLNWILFDEQFNFVSSNSGFEQVPAETAFGTVPNQIVYPHVKSNLTIDKCGYLYVYVSNETPNIDVYFDNLQVTHVRGPIMETSEYYPFGLLAQGISYRRAGGLENKYKFNGYEQQNKEFSDGSGLEWYDYKNRFYDNQLGRFFCVDKLADKFPYYTPYQFAGNEPTNAIDLDGLEPLYVIDSRNPSDYSKKETRQALKQAMLKYLSFTDANDAAVLTTMGTRGSSNAVNIDGTDASGTDKGFAIAGAIIPFVSGSLVKKFFNGIGNLFSGSKSVWAKNALERGLDIERQLGGNLPANFPVIDKLENGVATSIKSLDLTADSYTKGNGVLNTLNGYINKLDNFSTGSLSGVTVTQGVNFTTKTLEVGIQPGKATLGQWEQIGKAMQSAKDKGIDFKLQFIK